ncbi:MAG: TIGR04053 family radical SAM/SPASM domain-containing protein [bacterium]|nr:TIGR04053 family radical SAM/SPASM domain-containing protein [bacterium]
MPAGYGRVDFHRSPFLVFWEITQACDLVCKHCRACAQPDRHPEELTLPLCHKLIEQLASFPQRPILVLTGGDPMKRDDVFEVIRAGIDAGLTVTMTPSATPLVTPQAIEQLKAAGLSRLAVSIDGVDAATHDAIRGVPGSFHLALQIIREARAVGLPVQINTMVSRRNVEQVDAMAELIVDLDIMLWSVFFLVPVGRGTAEERIEPEQYEEGFERLWHHAQRKPYSIKTTEAHHYRRFVLQRGGNPQRGAGEAAGHTDRIQRAPLGVSDGKGCMFVSHIGQIFPSGFLPIEAGRFPRDSIVDVYQNARIFKELRDPDGFGGKCGRCEFRHVCGGSRARAYAVTGDYLAAEPDCIYQPAEPIDHVWRSRSRAWRLEVDDG